MTLLTALHKSKENHFQRLFFSLIFFYLKNHLFLQSRDTKVLKKKFQVFYFAIMLQISRCPTTPLVVAKFSSPSQQIMKHNRKTDRHSNRHDTEYSDEFYTKLQLQL